MGFVMSFQNDDVSVGKHTSTLFMLICTSAGFLIGLAWLGASYYAVRHEMPKVVRVLGFVCIFTFILPVGAVVAGTTCVCPMPESNGFSVFLQLIWTRMTTRGLPRNLSSSPLSC